MKEIGDENTNSTVSDSSRNIAVICQKSKDLYLANPKLVRRLPREQRAYWYWFLKHHQHADQSKPTVQ